MFLLGKVEYIHSMSVTLCIMQNLFASGPAASHDPARQSELRSESIGSKSLNLRKKAGVKFNDWFL